MERLFGIMLVAAGLFILPFQPACVNAVLNAGRYAGESPKWPTATGWIVKSEYTRTRPTRYVPRIVYSYRAQGREWTSATLALDHGLADGLSIDLSNGTLSQDWLDLSDARRLVARYPVNQAVTVHYDPHEPGRAVLIPGVKSGMTGDLIGCAVGFAVSFSLLGGGMWLLRADRVRARKESS
jgi:hypothetical protein